MHLLATTMLVASVSNPLAWPRQSEGSAPPAAAAPKATPLDRFKALKGAWNADIDGDGAPDTTVEYRVVGSGSAVVETLFGGTEHEMVTVYHMDGKDLLCTHYCAAGNQPRLRAERIDETSVAFEMKDITNLSAPGAMHMHAVTFTWSDDGSVRAVWRSVVDGKPGHTADFRMKRKS